MSDLAPVVRHMLLCDDVRTDPDDPKKVDLLGLVSTIRAGPEEVFPLRHSELCVYLHLTSGRRTGQGKIVAVEADSERIAFTSASHRIAFGTDPLAVEGLVFRIKKCVFPRPGLYWIQFRFDDKVIAQESLLLKVS